MKATLKARSIILSIALFVLFVFAWHLYVQSQTGPAVAMDPEYAKLMGATAKGASAMPGPLEVGKAIWKHFANPFYDVGPNDKGLHGRSKENREFPEHPILKFCLFLGL